MRRPVVLLVVFLLQVGTAWGQDDVIARAREAASAGRRPEALVMLEQHLASSPRDVDARLVYGLILSWEGRYDDARRELQQVLAQTPNYTDARVALMNVEWWSGRTNEARDLVNSILTREPGNAQARLVQQRLDAGSRPWRLTTYYTVDTFNEDRDTWQELQLSISRQTPVGSVIVRGSAADRFDLKDGLVEVEFYPTFRAGSYAFIGVGMATDELLYPEYRAAFDLYQSIGRGFELSGGYRRLQFEEATSIYLGALTKYVGNWMLTGRVSYVPGEADTDAWSYLGESRRYFGAEGRSFIGFTYSHGFNREEPRGLGDTIRIDSDTVRGQAEIDVTPRTRVLLWLGTSRQERALRDSLWQTTVAGGLTFRF